MQLPAYLNRNGWAVPVYGYPLPASVKPESNKGQNSVEFLDPIICSLTRNRIALQSQHRVFPTTLRAVPVDLKQADFSVTDSPHPSVCIDDYRPTIDDCRFTELLPIRTRMTNMPSVPLPSVICPPKRILMGPGPSDISPRVLAAMGAPTVGHLDPYFLRIMEIGRAHV